MAEKIREVRTFELNHECEEEVKGKKCGGLMRATGQQLEGMRTPMMKHACPKCRAVKFLNGVYPQMISLPINFQIPEQWVPLIDREHFRDAPDGKKIVLE